MENDEIGQFVKLEIQGLEMVIKAPLQVAALIGRAIKALMEYSQGSLERKTQKMEYKERLDVLKTKERLANAVRGECTVSDLIKISDGAMPMSIQPHDEYKALLLQNADRMGLHYAPTFDFDTTDKRTPFCIPPQEKAVWDTLISGFEKKMNEKYKKDVKDYDDQIAEKKEQIVNCRDETEKNNLNNQIEDLETARSEVIAAINDSETKPYAVNFNDYLAAGAGTDFEKNPERAVEFALDGAQAGNKFPAGEVLNVKRDGINVPDSRLYFYLPDTGKIIKREFKQNENTKLWESYYSIKLDNGEKFELSDKNISYTEWNEKYKGQLLDKAGCLENTMCYVFDNEHDLTVHIEKTKSQAPTKVEETVKKKFESAEPVFSTPQAEREVLNALDENKKARDFNEIYKSSAYTITCDMKELYQRNGKLRMKLTDTEYIEFSGVINPSIGKDGQGTFSVDERCKPTYVNTDPGKMGLTTQNKEIKEIKLDMTQLNELITSRKHNDMATIMNRKQGTYRR